ncbi:MAG: sulfite oxidase [Rubrobacter sp.]
MEPSKDRPEMIVHQGSPSNAETRVGALRESFITPTGLFFSRNHSPFPEFDAGAYRLSVSGLVDEILELSGEEIWSMPRAGVAVTATLQCAGNRREGMISVKDIPGETPWRAGAVGNASWTGVPLRDILALAGVKEGARYVAFESFDEVEGHEGESGHFGASIPLEKALGPEVLLAYGMNGGPLPHEHGGPLRVVVPGYTGARSVKWLSNIELRETPSENYYQARDYRLYAPNVAEETARPEEGIPLDEALVNSAICEPPDGASLGAGTLTVRGYATAGGGRRVARVDVSSDGGATWRQARLGEGRNDPWTWTFWETEIEAGAGAHDLVVRAVDSSANVQPESAAGIWNHRGYANNSWHGIRVHAR